MKKIFLFILVFVIVLYCVSFNTVYAYTDTVEEYQVNAPDWSSDEFINYYLENQILPASAPSGTENRIFRHYNGIQNHLNCKLFR